ncbi:MAG TPA: hypothetical protein PKI32_06390 [Opitutales bacterium]|nr:hypothetical protein [Opitutales bacterium]
MNRLRITILFLVAAAFAVVTSAGESSPALPVAPILKNPPVLTAETLGGVRLLELSGARHFSAEETALVTGFIRSGGSLLVVIDEENRTPLFPDGSEALIEPFGLRFSADTPYLHNCGAIARKGTVVGRDCELPYSGGRAVEGGTPFAWRLDDKGEAAEVFAACAEVPGGGRIVALAEGMAYLGMGSPDGVRLSGVYRDPAHTTYWGKDSAAFMEEVRSWLLHGDCAAAAAK